MPLLRRISFSWFEQEMENGKRYRHMQKFFYHSKHKAMYTAFHFEKLNQIKLFGTVFITKW